MSQPLLTRYMQPLLAGRRAECFDLMKDAVANGLPAREAICGVVWPAMAQIDRLYRDHRISTLIENMANRINRTVADQLQAHLPRQAPRNQRILITCAEGANEELGAQMVADLFQSDGWEVTFLGAGVPHDEILSLIGTHRPAILLIFGTQPQGVPEVRRLISWIREVDVCPAMNVIVSGGVYNRADGLWQEVGADVFAESAADVLRIANELPPRRAQPSPPGLAKKRRRRRIAS